MYNVTDIVNLLFKRIIGNKSNTNNSLSFDEEQYSGRIPVLLQDIWLDVIPTANPLVKRTYTTGALYPTVSPIVKKWDKEILLPITTSSSNKSFKSSALTGNVINSEYGNGTYQYKLWKKDVNGEYTIEVPFGYQDWLFDSVNAILTFYGEMPKGVSADSPPAITCYQYVGDFGSRENLGGGDLSSDSLDNVTVVLNDDDKIEVAGQYRTSYYYSDKLNANANVVYGQYTINHGLESIMVDAVIYHNNDDETKDKVEVPWKILNDLNIQLNFSPNVRAGDFSVLVTSRY